MSQMDVKSNSPKVLEVEIRPDTGSKWFWVVWTGSAAFILGAGWHQLGDITSRSLLIWMIFLAFAAAFLLKGWQAWVWASHGVEKVRVESGELIYHRVGSILDRKSVRIDLKDIVGVVVLAFGLGDSWEPNRLQLKTRKSTLYLGRGLSTIQGRELSKLLDYALFHSVESKS